MLGNSQRITPDMYRLCCEQAAVLQLGLRDSAAALPELATPSLRAPGVVPHGHSASASSTAASPAESVSARCAIRKATGREPSLQLIAQDIPRTFPTLAFFHEDGPLAAPLHRILEAYACFRPDVGCVAVAPCFTVTFYCVLGRICFVSFMP